LLSIFFWYISTRVRILFISVSGGAMKKWSFFACAILSILLFIIPGTVFAAKFELAAGIWNQDPSGDFSYKGDSLNVKDDLGFGEETRFLGRAKIEILLGLPNVYLMVTPMKFDGAGSKNQQFIFNNKTFQANIPFTSSLQFDQYDIVLYYGLPFLKIATAGVFNIDLGIGAKIIDSKAAIDQPDTGLSESKSLTIGVPTVYVGAQANPVKLIGFEAEGKAGIYNSSHYYDLIGRLKIRPVGPLFIAGGYRYEEVKLDASGVKGKVTVKGPFVEAGLEF
jgi:outer membrane protein